MKKDIEWLKEKVKGEYEYDRVKHCKEDEGYAHREFVFKYVLGLLDQLDEPEVLSQEWIDEHATAVAYDGMPDQTEIVYVDDLENLVIPKEESEITLNRAFEKVSEIYPITKEEVCRHLEKVTAYGGKVTYRGPEVLSKEWVNNNVVHVRGLGDIFEAETVESLLVPKQELPVIPKYVADWITNHRDNFDLYPALKRLEDSSFISEQAYKWYRTNTHEFVNAYLTGEYEVEEEPLYYALIKGHELIDDGGMFWNFDMFDEKVIISPLNSPRDSFLTKMSKEDWNKLGINDSNADFVKVGEVK